MGTRSLAGAAGKLALVVPAKFPKRALRTGRYRLTVTARDKAGNTSRARTLTVTVKR